MFSSRRNLALAAAAATTIAALAIVVLTPLLWGSLGRWLLPSIFHGPVVAAAATPTIVSSGTAPSSPLATLAQKDPLVLARMAMERYGRDVHSYRCVLVKQERIDGELTPVQEIEVRYREKPLTVYMLWQKNEADSRRALYVKSPEFVDDEGRPVARVEPAGSVVRLFVKDIFVPIHGDRARAASRRFMDDFGFRRTLELLAHHNALARKNGVLELRYGGESEVEGRPTYVLLRYLPYAGEGGPYPDARLEMHFDQETLMPIGVLCYADRAGEQLLGSYLFTKVELNPGFTDADFAF